MPKVRAEKKRTAHVFNSKWRSTDVILKEEADFASLLLSERVLKGLKKAGFKKPSPIQLEAIPFGRYGKDLFIQAKSGTGKTLVFTIVALEMLRDVRCPQVLVIAPTREIADQIREVVTSVGVGFKNLTCCSFIGGIPVQEDRAKGHSCQIAVGTPGRVKQLISDGVLPTNSIRLFVLDEADVLLNDKSFASTIMDIFHSLPKEKQVIATSATYPSNIKKIMSDYFRDPYLTRLEKENLSLLGTIHYEQEVQHSSLVALAYKFKVKALEKILERVKFSQCLVFCNQLAMVELLCKDIKKLGFTATYISSAKEQRDRLKAIDALKRFKCKILICTDLTSRGIDAENVDLIINFDCPNHTDTYLHRVGRAGRYGARGVAITFRTEAENIRFRRFQKDANFRVHNLPNPLVQDLINFLPNNLNDSKILSEDLELEQNSHIDCNDNVEAQINSSKYDIESTVLTVENVLHSKFDFINEMKGDEAVTPPGFHQNLLSRKADKIKDEEEKKSTDTVRKEAEENANFKMELLLNRSKNNNIEDIRIKEIDTCGSQELDHALNEIVVENENNCEQFETKNHHSEEIKLQLIESSSSKELDHSLYMNKIVVENENKFEQFETKSRGKLLQSALNPLDVPNHFQNRFEETNLLTEQASIVKEISDKEINSALSETNIENYKAEKNVCSGKVINDSVSKFIHSYEKKYGHSLSGEEITEVPFGTKKCVTQNDINVLRSHNHKFFYNVLANLFHHKLKEEKSCMMNTAKNNLVKDHSQLQGIDGNVSNKEVDLRLDSGKSSNLRSLIEFSNEDHFNSICEVSSEKTSSKDILDKKHILKSAPSIKNNTSSTMNSFKNEMTGEVIYCSLKADKSIINYFESSDAEINDDSESSFDECVECSPKNEKLSQTESDEFSDEENEECSGESESSSNESRDLEIEETGDEISEKSSDLDTDESSEESSEESSDLETDELSEESSEESSSETESSSTDVSDSDNKQSSEFEHASSKLSSIQLQNKKYKNMKNNKKEIFKVKKERFRPADSHSKKQHVNDNLCCSSSSHCSSSSDSFLKRETRKTVCFAKANAIPRQSRKDEPDRKTNCKTFSNKSSPKPFHAASTSNYPQENYSPHICCCCQNVKYPNYGHSSKLNDAQHDCQCCRPANRHFSNAAVNLNNQDHLCKMWYQIFYNQYFWIKHTAFNMSKHF